MKNKLFAYEIVYRQFEDSHKRKSFQLMANDNGTFKVSRYDYEKNGWCDSFNIKLAELKEVAESLTEIISEYEKEV